MDRDGRRARFADRALALTAARLIILKQKMPRRPSVRALLIAGLCDARKKPVRPGKPTDHALIAARSRGHMHKPVACLRRGRPVNGDRPSLHRSAVSTRDRGRSSMVAGTSRNGASFTASRRVSTPKIETGAPPRIGSARRFWPGLASRRLSMISTRRSTLASTRSRSHRPAAPSPLTPRRSSSAMRSPTWRKRQRL